MARPPYLSPSAWGRWEQCQQSWAFRYVEGLPDPGSIHTVHGLIVHETLDMLMSLEPDDRTTSVRDVLLEMALEHHADQIEQLKLDAGLIARWARESLETFPSTEPATPWGADVLATERRHEMVVEGVPVLLIVDRIDRKVDKLGHETALSIDYKSSRKAKMTSAIQRQMVLSAIAAEQITGLPATPEAEVRFVRVGQTRHVKTGAAARATVAEDLQRAWRQIAGAVVEDDFRVSPSPLCHFCSYQEHCPEGAREARRYRERKGIR